MHMPIEVVCSKCGSVIYKMVMLKPIKDVLKAYTSRCPNCRAQLLSEFIIEVSRV